MGILVATMIFSRISIHINRIPKLLHIIARSALYVRRAQSNWMSVRACVVRKILEIMYWGNEGWTHTDPLRKWNHWNLGGSQKDTIQFQLAHKEARLGGPTFWTLFAYFFTKKSSFVVVAKLAIWTSPVRAPCPALQGVSSKTVCHFFK